MDTTYVGKAFWGMLQYLGEKEICGRKILFSAHRRHAVVFDKLVL